MIDFDPLGTIRFSDIADEPVTIRRPKLGQYRWFQRSLTAILDDASNALNTIRERAEAGEDVAEEAAAIAENPLEARLNPWWRELFSQLGDRELPEDTDEWPAYFADPSLPNQVLAHWRTAPKASGSNRRG